jgi:hypothetical protein
LSGKKLKEDMHERIREREREREREKENFIAKYLAT